MSQNTPGPLSGYGSLWPFINQGTALGPEFIRAASGASSGTAYRDEPNPVAIKRSLAWRAVFAWYSLFWLILWTAAAVYGLVTAHLDNMLFAGVLAVTSLCIFVRTVRGIRRRWAVLQHISNT